MPMDVGQIHREQVEAFIVHLLDTRAPATASNRFRALQRLFNWMVDEGEIVETPTAQMKRPKVDEAEVPVVSDADLRALLAACKGNRVSRKTGHGLDPMLLDTGGRLSEIANLLLDGLDLPGRGVAVVSGKGVGGSVRCRWVPRRLRQSTAMSAPAVGIPGLNAPNCGSAARVRSLGRVSVRC